jgi:hypothetical protein
MTYIKRVYEMDEKVRGLIIEINETILDECDSIQNFIDELDDQCKIFITSGNVNIRYSSISTFKKYIKDNIDKPIPTIQYSLSSKINKKGDDILRKIESLEKRIDSRIDNLSINENHKYNKTYTKSNKHLKFNQKYEVPYLISNLYETTLYLSLVNLKDRYFNSNPEIFSKRN